MRNLIKQLGLGPEFEEGLGGLNVEKIDYYRNDNLILIRVDSPMPDNSEDLIESLKEQISNRTGSTVKIEFKQPKPHRNMYGLDPEIYSILEEEEQAKKEKAAAKKKEKESEGNTTTSWGAKAKEAKDQVSDNGG